MARVFKRIVLLSPVGGVTPVFNVEKQGAVWEYRLSFDGAYDDLIVSDGETCRTIIKKEGLVDLNVEEGLAVAVIFNGQITSFGTGGLTMTKTQFEKRFLNVYDDETIATENYYRKGYEQKHENADVEDGSQTGKAGKESDGDARQDDAGGNVAKKQNADGRRTQTVDGSDGAYTAEREYREQVASNIAALFHAGTPYPQLSRVIPLSRWVRITDDKKTYFFGLQGAPDYICYAVKGVRGDPPEGFEQAFFVPESFFNDLKDGYFITFQSAKTGEYVCKKSR